MSGLLAPMTGFPITQGFTGHNLNEPAGRLSLDQLSAKLVLPIRGQYPPGTTRHLHMAQDISCPIGTPIKAPAAGIIVAQGTIARFLNGTPDGEHYVLLQIERDSRNQTILEFTHLSAFVLKVGAHVKRGQVIAKSGNSGVSTGPHLHWQVCTGPSTASPSAIVWGKVGTRWDPAQCETGGKLAGRGWLVSNV